MLALAAWNPSRAADPAEAAFFEKSVQPLLVERCGKCHSHASGKSKGGLLLDSHDAIMAGGESGPAVEPGDPDKSRLIVAVRYQDEDLQMPPKGEKLSPEQVALLVDWVKRGAPGPAVRNPAGSVAKRKPGKITDEDRAWWSFQPMRSVTLPTPAGALDSGNEVDRFILARLEKEGLTPAPAADRIALIRRVTFDLIGLPPTPEEVDAFVRDPAPDAYGKLVDRLLASPRHGERAARHWLDLVRYADSDGYRIDDYRPEAWRYRDYVIRAFNGDKPYDRFLLEQLAGDELFPGDPDALIATGFLRHWVYEYNNRDVRQHWATILNDITDTTADVFLGLGLQCARCHDHKFDPLLQRDYFRLQAFFSGMLPREDLPAATAEEIAAYTKKLAAWEAKTARLREQLAALEKTYRDAAERDAVGKFPADIQAMIRKPAAERLPLETQYAALAWRQVEYDWGRLDGKLKGEEKEKIFALRKEIAAFDAEKPAPLPHPPAVTDLGTQAAPVTIPKKGKDDILPGFPTILSEAPAEIVPMRGSTGRRAALARWLVAPTNPLTARVIVNRVWQEHFGRGLAVNASDFGKLGDPPSHPELLDWLARRFIDGGWSIKELRRLLVTSATYQRSCEHPAPDAGRLKDPENKLLWRALPRRLEAEQIRDAVLAVTGELKLDQAGGPGVTASEPQRTIYTRIMRNTRDPLADVFDAPLWFASASSRDVTTTPVQSLLLANSPYMIHRGRRLAERVAKGVPADPAAQVRTAYHLVFGRAPTDQESRTALAFLADQQPRVDAKRATSAKATFLPEKVPYRDGQAALIEPDGAQRVFRVMDSEGLRVGTQFTIEAFFVPRSIADSGAVRTLAGKWSGSVKEPGWIFGVTGKKSRRKPYTIVLQTVGKHRDSVVREHPIFADFTIQPNKPYFVAASFRGATTGAQGIVTFFLKDLSNDDEPLLSAVIRHEVTGGLDNDTPLTIGGRSSADPQSFHGPVDDVRLSDRALEAAQLLFQSEAIPASTMGYWRFEAKPDVFGDASGHGRVIAPLDVKKAERLAPVDPQRAALADFCHALLNASEFLYVP